MIQFFFTFFPLPQTSQPVTFPDGSLAQEGSEPCRPRWLVSWVEQGWSEYKSDNQRFSNHLQFSTGCPQVCSIFIGASVNVWPINPMRYLVQLLPLSICLKMDVLRRQCYLVWRPHFKLGEERLRAKFIHVFFPWDYHTFENFEEVRFAVTFQKGSLLKSRIGLHFSSSKLLQNVRFSIWGSKISIGDGNLRWECSVLAATLDSMIWCVGDVVVDELAHLKDR